MGNLIGRSLHKILALVLLPLALSAQASPATYKGSIVRLSPANGARTVNPDTHLDITFLSPPTIGDKGSIRIYDAADHRLVDTLDLGIPAGPDYHRRRPEGSPPDTTVYQSYTIGGVAGFHAYPIIVAGRMATIYPHHHVLEYGHRYIVKIDLGVLNVMAGFSGFASDAEWTFTTKSAPPANVTKLVVAADASGDFNTVQGALDFVPDRPKQPITIFIKNGNYEELVFARNKSNLLLRGEDRDNVRVGYGNNSAFNPPEEKKSNRRPAFSLVDSTDIQLSNFTINNYFIGQAEALLVSGARNIVDHVTLNGSGDALQIRGSLYMTDSRLTGHGDTILSVGPAFFNRTEIQSIGPFNWVRNTDKNHGHVFKECTFIGIDEPLPWTRTADGGGQRTPSVLARLPNNHSLNYPYAEAVLINSRLQGVSPEGWGPIEEDSATFSRANIHFWEFNSMDMNGKPLDLSQRHPVAKQLTLPKDAKLIADYSNPEFVLGWKPVLR